MEETRPQLIDRLPWYTAPAILLGVPAIIWLLTLVDRSRFYVGFVWKYYWGPIKADAMGQAKLTLEGVDAHSGYNVVNTLTWAVLLGVCILGVAQMLRHYRTTMDSRLIIGATAWVVAGSIFHVVEDTDLFARPLQYFFITPPIYLLFAAFGILSFLIGQYLKAVTEAAGIGRAFQKLWLIYAVLVVVYLNMWLYDWPQIHHYINPIWVVLFAAASFAITVWRFGKTRRFDPTEFVLHASVGWLLASIAFIAHIASYDWIIPHSNAMPMSWLYAIALAGGTTALVAVVAKRMYRAKKTPGRAAFLVPINLLLIFGQMVDGFATALGIDLAGYSEKHVLSANVIDWTRNGFESLGWAWGAAHPTFLGFVPVKLAVSLAVVYALDGAQKPGEVRNETLLGLVKFAIIMVGLGPGIRDFTRLSIGI